MTALKAAWEVRVGIIPGQPMPELTKLWCYTSDDFEKDRNTPPEEMTIFTNKLNAAHKYAMQMTNPRSVNWIELSFVWY